MNKLIPLALLATGALLGTTLISPAVAQQHGMPPTHTAQPTKTSASDMMHSSMTKMSKSMAAMKMTGDTDKDFAMMMAEHHRGAILMAEIEVKHGKNAELKAMAKKMIAAQKKERTALLKHAKMKH